MVSFLAHASLYRPLLSLFMIGTGTAVRVSRSYGSKPQETAAPFPWHLPSCDMNTLDPQQLSTAFAVERSLGGSMGGVYFLALQSPNECILVAKPKVDLHDVFASTLADELGAPVIRSRVVRKSEPLLQATLQAISGGSLKRFPDQKEVAESLMNDFMEAMGADIQNPKAFEQLPDNTYIQLMAKSIGKDPYNHLKGLQFEACEKCKVVAIEEEIEKKFEDKIEEKIAGTEYKVINGDPPNMFEKKMFVNALGEDFEQELEGSDDDLKKSTAKKLREWMLANPTDKTNTLKSIFAEKKREMNSKLKLAETMCHGWNFGEQQSKETVEERIKYVRDAFRDNTKKVGALAAFVSIVGEYDSIPAPGFRTPMSNMMNIMVAPQGIEGIDIAVGGATSHFEILKDGSKGPPVFEVKSFFSRQAARMGVCKKSAEIDPEEVDQVEASLRFRINMPFFAGPYHRYGKQCHLEHSTIFKEEEINGIVRDTMQELSIAFREYIGKMGRSVAMTAARLSGLGGPETMTNIVGWLMHRVDQFQQNIDEADMLCPQSLPDSPVVDETHGNSMDGRAPPMPPSFNKHSNKHGYVWHTVETMWKKSHGQWFGTRTTDIVAVPLKPAQ